jgi:hypothetical protein
VRATLNVMMGSVSVLARVNRFEWFLDLAEFSIGMNIMRYAILEVGFKVGRIGNATVTTVLV